MSPVIRFRDLRFAYPESDTPVLDGVDLDVESGEFMVLAGPSGSGKSTLLRVVNGLVPHFTGGRFGGSACVAGRDIRIHSPRQMSDAVGIVFQDPEPQMITSRVDDEIAFAMEQQGIPRSTMRQRLEEVLDLTGIAHLRHREPQALSGGEQQRVAIAAAMALRPEILVLDEPTSQLDPAGAEAVIEALARLHDDLGVTIVLAEHRLERLLSRADRLRALDRSGTVVTDTHPVTAVLALESAALPPITRLARELGWQRMPLTVNEARRMPEGGTLRSRLARASPGQRERGMGASLAVIRGLSVQLGRRQVLQDIDLSVHEGEIVALMGRNGSGKTTLLRSLVGFQAPSTGTVTPDESRGYAWLPQQPGSIFFRETLADEVAWTLRRRRSSQTVDAVLAEFGLGAKARVHPRDLSGGERERAALATVLAGDPALIALDEPTRGMDSLRKQELAAALERRRRQGAGIVLATHDVELAATIATRIVVLGEGELIADGPPREILAGSLTLATQVNRLLGGGWLTVDEVLAALA